MVTRSTNNSTRLVDVVEFLPDDLLLSSRELNIDFHGAVSTIVHVTRDRERRKRIARPFVYARLLRSLLAHYHTFAIVRGHHLERA